MTQIRKVSGDQIARGATGGEGCETKVQLYRAARWRAFIAAALLLVANEKVVAQAPPSPTGAPLPPPPAPTPFATSGPWSFTGLANIDAIGNVSGGRKTAIKGLQKFALAVVYDGAQDDHEGLSGLASLQYVGGGRPTAKAIGDLQGVDNIEAFGALRLYELWVSRDYDGAKGWKAGFIDLNVDFDTNETGALFLNSSDGIGPELGHSGLNGPAIYPTTALGVTSYLRKGVGLTFRAGIFDGTAGSPYHPGDFAVRLSGKDGVFVIAQVERRFNGGLRIEGGAWGYSAHFDALDRFDAQSDPLRYQRSRGAYALVEAPLLKAGDDGERGLSGWVRMGLADPVVQQINGYVGGGLVYTGPLAHRVQDQVGLSINHAIVRAYLDPANTTTARRSETAFELTYRYNANDWLAMQPDTQLVLHPAGALPTAFVVGLRLSVTLSKTLLAKVKDAAP